MLEVLSLTCFCFAHSKVEAWSCVWEISIAWAARSAVDPLETSTWVSNWASSCGPGDGSGMWRKGTWDLGSGLGSGPVAWPTSLQGHPRSRRKLRWSGDAFHSWAGGASVGCESRGDIFSRLPAAADLGLHGAWESSGWVGTTTPWALAERY